MKLSTTCTSGDEHHPKYIKLIFIYFNNVSDGQIRLFLTLPPRIIQYYYSPEQAILNTCTCISLTDFGEGH